MTLSEFTDFFDFSCSKDKDGYYLIDNQGADLGKICSERFNEPWEVVERFNGSIYEPDYITDDLEDEYGYTGDYSREDLYNFAKENAISYANILYVMMDPKSIIDDVKEE